MSDLRIRSITGKDNLPVSFPTGISIGAGGPTGVNDIGIAGSAGFGVGIYPGELPSGFTAMSGYADPLSHNYGNYQYSDGSVMCWIPAFYYKIGTGANGLAVNVIDVKAFSEYKDKAAANAAGYALPRAFINAGAVRMGVMVDKYQCSNNSGTASSLKNGNPLSSNSAHNPFSGVGAANYYYGAIDAAKSRGSEFFCNSRFIFTALAMLSVAHGQAASSNAYCAWYDAAGVTNFPKGCNDNALGDTNDNDILYVSDGYSNCGKAGSANLFARTTHNGQDCGVADLNGNMWEINLGMTRPGSSSGDTAQQNDTTAFYILKESVDIADLTSGWNGTNDAWGDSTHLATLYDSIDLAHISQGDGWRYFGNGSNQVLSEATSGDNYRMANVGVYTSSGESASGTNLFGNDGLYEYHRANLCLHSGGTWDNGSKAGVWALLLSLYRTSSSGNIGFRAAAYV